MTWSAQHCLPTAPSHLSPIPHAWNLSPQFISLFSPLSCTCFFSYSCLYVTYLFMIHFPLCPLVPHACTSYVSALIPVSVCATQPTLIFLTRRYKPRTSHMSPQFIYQLRLNYYCHSLPALNLSLPLDISGNCSTLEPLPFDFMPTWKLFPWYPMTLWLPWNPWEGHIPIYLKYLDCDRRPAQHTSWSHCPYPPSHLETWDLISMSGSLGLTRNSIWTHSLLICICHGR